MPRKPSIGVVAASCLCALALIAASPVLAAANPEDAAIDINVVVDGDVTDAVLADLGTHGRLGGVIKEIDAVTLQAPASQLGAIRGLPYVAAANPDAERTASPVDTVAAEDLSGGRSSWNQDLVNATVRPGISARALPYDGAGVYVAVLDTGLVDSWRQYFPEERIATRWAKAFSGGGGPGWSSGGNRGVVTEPPNQWEHDQNSHGTHVTSTILGFNFGGTVFNGTAPKATVIPVKVLNQAGWGRASGIARAVVYVAGLKASGALGASPVVMNMSLGGPPDAMERAALEYAVARGVVVVASAGNSGGGGMVDPAAYSPVISVAAAGWTGQWQPGGDANPRNWWWADDVAEPTSASDVFISDFSSRQKPGQDLDVTAPGQAVVGPYQTQSGQTSHFFLSGTSMSSPHVAGIAALMLQKNGSLAPAQVESILESSAIPVDRGCRSIKASATSGVSTICWDAASGDADGAGFATADAALGLVP